MSTFKDLEFYAKESGIRSFVKINEDQTLAFSVREMKWPLNTGKWMIDTMKKEDGEWKPLKLNCLDGHDRLFEEDDKKRHEMIENAKAEIQNLAEGI